MDYESTAKDLLQIVKTKKTELLFTKTNSGGTDHVWFYDMQSDGFSLDDKRTPQPDKSDLPDILKRWRSMKAEGGIEKKTHGPVILRSEFRNPR